MHQVRIKGNFITRNDPCCGCLQYEINMLLSTTLVWFIIRECLKVFLKSEQCLDFLRPPILVTRTKPYCFTMVSQRLISVVDFKQPKFKWKKKRCNISTSNLLSKVKFTMANDKGVDQGHWVKVIGEISYPIDAFNMWIFYSDSLGHWTLDSATV